MHAISILLFCTILFFFVSLYLHIKYLYIIKSNKQPNILLLQKKVVTLQARIKE